MFDALSACFRDWVADRGSAEVLAAVFPKLAEGVAATAFHGLIRLAYGIEANHAGEIGAGLAMLCARYAELAIDVDRAPPSASVEAAFARLAEALGGAVFTGQGIIGKMQAAAADPRFRAAFSRPPLGPALLEEVAGIAIALYWQVPDFTVLHLVTTCHAARVLFGAAPQLAAPQAIKALWLAVCAAYVSVGAPALRQTPLEAATADWPEVFAQAIASNDDHVIKMVYTRRCEAAHYGSPLYQAAAARLATAGKA